jgi:hypothetical protein
VVAGPNGSEDVLCPAEIDFDGAARLLDDPAHANGCSQVKDRVARRCQVLDERPLEDASLGKVKAGPLEMGSDVLEAPCGEVVEYPDFVAVEQEPIDQVRPDEARTTRDKCPHRLASSAG